MSVAVRGLPVEPALGIAGAVLLPTTFVLMLRGVPPFVTHAYELSWWSLIACLDGLVWRRTRRSPLGEAPFRFLLLAVWSVALWFFFEILNLRLRNWHYVFVGAGTVERWTGSFIAYATVIPGVFLIAEALRAWTGWPREEDPLPRAPARSSALPGWVSPLLVLLGLVFFVLPLLWPRYFYPLVWGSLVLLLDPLNRRLGGRSFLGELERGGARTLLLYLAAGAAAGLIWELLNYWARVKWIYTVPFFEETKLFEMPLLGFVGFLPFALECWVVVETLEVLGLVPARGSASAPASSRGRRAAGQVAWALLASAVLAAVALPGMERLTIASLYPRLEDLEEISPVERAALRDRGVRDTFDLRRELEREGQAASPLGRKLELALFAGIGIEKAEALLRLGVDSVEALAGREGEELWRGLQSFDLRHRPTPAEVRHWLRKARARAAEAAR